VRVGAGRLFDSSGKASLTLNVDEFTLAVSLRTGIFVFEAEDVFRWLRHFRDENFFGDVHNEPTHPDAVRDLRKAAREPTVVHRGVRPIDVQPATRHFFRAASGAGNADFYLLGRTAGVAEHSPSLILHVVDGAVAAAHSLDEPLNHLYVTPRGTMWGLSLSGAAVRFSKEHARTFPLRRRTRGRAWWYGIGGIGERVLVWGAGALLELQGDEFVPFKPDGGLEDGEAVVALAPEGSGLAMLVCSDLGGAVARFDDGQWLPIVQDQVIDGALADLDVWRDETLILSRDGRLWRALRSARPRPVSLDERHPAFSTDTGVRRAMHAVRAVDGGTLIASDGGVIAALAGDPVFHAAPDSSEPAHLSRVGGGIVATCGPNAWLWRRRAFHVLDLRQW
jgi:hypothetical protein